ncbi:MAG: hypothetical protein ACRC37_08505 [Lentisphaeria bacterium]
MNKKLLMYLHNELSNEDRQHLEAELLVNEQLREEFEELEVLDQELPNVFMEVGRGVEFGVENRVKVLGKIRRGKWRLLLGVVSSLAASILVAFLLTTKEQLLDAGGNDISGLSMEEVAAAPMMFAMEAPKASVMQIPRGRSMKMAAVINEDYLSMFGSELELGKGIENFDIQLALDCVVFSEEQTEKEVGNNLVRIYSDLEGWILLVKEGEVEERYKVRVGREAREGISLALAIVLFARNDFGEAMDKQLGLLDSGVGLRFRQIVEKVKDQREKSSKKGREVDLLD